MTDEILLNELRDRLSIAISEKLVGKVLSRDTIEGLRDAVHIELRTFLDKNNLTLKLDENKCEVRESIELVELMAGVKKVSIDIPRNIYDTVKDRVGVDEVNNTLKSVIEKGYKDI